MEKIIFNVSVGTILIAGIIFFSSCNPATKGDDTETTTEKVEEGVEDATGDDWEVFRSDALQRVEQNNQRIAEHREKMKTAGKTMDKFHQNRIDELEQKNKELLTRVETYKKDDSNWESFKTEFKHDMEELEKALEDLGKDNK